MIARLNKVELDDEIWSQAEKSAKQVLLIISLLRDLDKIASF